jgi:hypothetical protein
MRYFSYGATGGNTSGPPVNFHLPQSTLFEEHGIAA